MTNITAAVIVLVSTNWVSIGTFTPKDGGSTMDVQAGTIRTNTTAIFEWEGQKHEVVLRSDDGPGVGERRILSKSSGLIFTFTNMPPGVQIYAPNYKIPTLDWKNYETTNTMIVE